MSNFRERTLSPIIVQWKMAKNLKGNQPLGDVYPFFTKNHGAMRGRVTNVFFPQVFMKPFFFWVEYIRQWYAEEP